MRSFLTGLTSLVYVAKDYWNLLKTIRKSNNWGIEWDRITHPMEMIEPAEFAIKAYATYARVTKLIAKGKWEKAG